MEIFESHAHYDDEKFDDDREEVLKDIYISGITKVNTVGYDLKSSKEAINLSQKYDFINAICGISPNDIAEEILEIDKQIDEIEELVKNNNVVAIGEIGLDYYWNKENKEKQKYAFIKQIELAKICNLPIVIHCRDAVDDILQILKNTKMGKGVFHCCMLNRELVKSALKLGFYISFAGSITFKNSKNASEIIKMVPMDKMLIETDSPYLAPEPKRGTRNTSKNLNIIVEKIAQVKEITAEEVARQTYKNAVELFNI